MDESKKRKQIKAYFFPYDKPEEPEKDSLGVVGILAGIGIGVVGISLLGGENACAGVIVFFLGIGALIGGIQANKEQNSKQAEYEESLKQYSKRLERWDLTESDLGNEPTGQQIDAWLREDLASIEEDALTHKLDLVRDQLKRDPLVIYGPLYWETYGIPDEELVYVKEKTTNILRFSCYRVVVVFLTETRVATYSCNFNFLRNARVGEKTVEYLYQDIVSVSTEEMSTNYSLPAGKTLQRAKVFRLAVASSDTIEVVVNSPQLKDILEGTLNLEDQDKNVQIIREMLRTKKG